jgi:Cu/Ag efflux protein CusF
MVSVSKVALALSCACFLNMNLSTAIPASEKHPAGRDNGQGIDTIKGEVVRMKGEHVYVKKSDGKEMHLHIKPTTQLMGEIKQGNHVEVKVDDQHNALSVQSLP